MYNYTYMTTLHILSSPHIPVHKDTTIDAFSISTLKFINYMTKYGWNCIHYGLPGAEVPCELVNCLPNKSADYQENIARYNEAAGREIAIRKKPGDIIVCMYGLENKSACDSNPELKTVEPGIGYSVSAAFATYKVFTSYAHMHTYYGSVSQSETPSWFDAVVPNGISANDFDYTEKKDDYLLIFGRVIPSKGIDLAIQVAEATNKKLVIAGAGPLADLNYTSIPSHVEMVGPCNREQRRKLMAKATAILGPTYYIEPFGNMIVEGYMSGTPAITTDWGGFTETVVQGVTGFRCREFREFVSAVNNIDRISPQRCRDWALSMYEDSVVHEQLHEYFKKIEASDFYRK
jgi:glycosyltransferase involved in cell wall biosynthesis